MIYLPSAQEKQSKQYINDFSARQKEHVESRF